MPNYQVELVNSMLNQSGILADLLGGGHLRRINGSVQRYDRHSGMRPGQMLFSEVTGYRKIEDDAKNEERLDQAFRNALSALHTAGSTAALSVNAASGDVRILVGSERGRAGKDLTPFLSNIPEIRFGGSLARGCGSMPSGADGVFGGVFAGMPPGSSIDLDFVIDSMEGRDYGLCVVAIPVGAAAMHALQGFLRSVQSDYEMISSSSSSGGGIQNGLRAVAGGISMPSVDQLLEIVREKRVEYAKGSAKGFFAACISYGAHEEGTAWQLGRSLSGAIQVKEGHSGDILHFPLDGM